MNATALLQGIRHGDDHTGGIRCLQLFRLEAPFLTALGRDVERLCRQESPSDVTRSEHITHWTRPFGAVLQFSLLNASGRYDDFSADHNLSCFGKQCHAGATYPTLAHFVEFFPHTVNFRINVLGPRAGLSPHQEHVLMRTRARTVGARVRFHLPIVTSPLAELMLDGHVYHLDAGTIYLVNQGCVHSATNRGEHPRIHLTWDMLLTREVFDCMFGDAPAPMSAFARIPEEERDPVPVRTERIGAYRRLPPIVSPEEAVTLDFCGIQ